MRQGISAVAFDLDGTLYPNYRLNIRLLPFLCKHGPLIAAFARARGIIRRRQEQSPSAVAPDFYDYQARLTADLLHAPPEQVKETIERLIYRGWERHFYKIKLFPHVREVLAELRTAGLKLGLLSDFPPQTKLNNLGLSACWDAVLCSEHAGAIKPALRPFAELADALRCPPEQVLYVGNSRPYDMAGARRAGMKTALFTGCFSRNRLFTGATGADFTFQSYRQLRNFVL
ncbi:MAG: HAD family hydrolase [Treponema sp.]|jgi:putative hydrolase of the HAD superfamily|nr:HAD family hydrolase [Treponema sp.]